jgi:hypothetical protein
MKKADNFDARKWLVENKLTTQSRLKEYSNDDDSDWMDQEEDDPNDYDEEGNMKDDAYRREFGYSFQEKQNYEKILDQVKEKYNFDPFDTNSLKNYDKIEAEAKEMYAQKYGSSFGESKLNEDEDSDIKNNIIIGYRWKSNQMRIDNLEEALAILGYGKNQSSLKNHYPIEGKRVAFYNLSDPDSASEKLRKAGKLDEWFEPVYK